MIPAHEVILEGLSRRVTEYYQAKFAGAPDEQSQKRQLEKYLIKVFDIVSDQTFGDLFITSVPTPEQKQQLIAAFLATIMGPVRRTLLAVSNAESAAVVMSIRLKQEDPHYQLTEDEDSILSAPMAFAQQKYNERLLSIQGWCTKTAQDYADNIQPPISSPPRGNHRQGM